MTKLSVWSLVQFYKCLENSWKFYSDFCAMLPEGIFVCEWKERGNRKLSAQNSFLVVNIMLWSGHSCFLKEALFWKKILSTKCIHSEALPLSLQMWQFIAINFFHSFYRKIFWIGKESRMRGGSLEYHQSFAIGLVWYQAY